MGAPGGGSRPAMLASRAFVTWVELVAVGPAGSALGGAVSEPPQLVVYLATTLLSVGVLLYNGTVDSGIVPSRPHPDGVLVSPEWVRERLDRFRTPGTDYRLLEVDLNTDFYDRGQVPGALSVDWTADLRASDCRDLVGRRAFARLFGECGIDPDTTLVVYGDNANWFATHLYWMCSYYGHDDVGVMDGGREFWMENGYP